MAPRRARALPVPAALRDVPGGGDVRWERRRLARDGEVLGRDRPAARRQGGRANDGGRAPARDRAVRGRSARGLDDVSRPRAHGAACVAVALHDAGGRASARWRAAHRRGASPAKASSARARGFRPHRHARAHPRAARLARISAALSSASRHSGRARHGRGDRDRPVSSTLGAGPAPLRRARARGRSARPSRTDARAGCRARAQQERHGSHAKLPEHGDGPAAAPSGAGRAATSARQCERRRRICKEKAIELALARDREAVRQGRRSCAGRRRAEPRRSTASRPARSGSTSRSASAACRAAASSRSTARSRRGKTTLDAARRSRKRQKRGGVARVHRRRARARRRPTRASSASSSTSCSSRSPTPASRRSRSPRCSCARGAVDVIVIDSVAALVPRAEIEGEMGDSHIGLQARLMSQALRKLTGTISQVATRTVIFINQIRMKIGVMFGNPETTTGGNALKFYASVRLDIRRIGAHQGRRRGRRQPHAREGREEQDGAAVPRGRVRHPLRDRHLEGGRPARPRRRARASSRRAAPGTRSTASASARAARTRRSS